MLFRSRRLLLITPGVTKTTVYPPSAELPPDIAMSATAWCVAQGFVSNMLVARDILEGPLAPTVQVKPPFKSLMFTPPSPSAQGYFNVCQLEPTVTSRTVLNVVNVSSTVYDDDGFSVSNLAYLGIALSPASRCRLRVSHLLLGLSSDTCWMAATPQSLAFPLLRQGIGSLPYVCVQESSTGAWYRAYPMMEAMFMNEEVSARPTKPPLVARCPTTSIFHPAAQATLSQAASPSSRAVIWAHERRYVDDSFLLQPQAAAVVSLELDPLPAIAWREQQRHDGAVAQPAASTMADLGLQPRRTADEPASSTSNDTTPISFRDSLPEPVELCCGQHQFVLDAALVEAGRPASLSVHIEGDTGEVIRGAVREQLHAIAEERGYLRDVAEGAHIWYKLDHAFTFEGGHTWRATASGLVAGAAADRTAVTEQLRRANAEGWVHAQELTPCEVPIVPEERDRHQLYGRRQDLPEVTVKALDEILSKHGFHTSLWLTPKQASEQGLTPKAPTEGGAVAEAFILPGEGGSRFAAYNFDQLREDESTLLGGGDTAGAVSLSERTATRSEMIHESQTSGHRRHVTGPSGAFFPFAISYTLEYHRRRYGYKSHRWYDEGEARLCLGNKLGGPSSEATVRLKAACADQGFMLPPRHQGVVRTEFNEECVEQVMTPRAPLSRVEAPPPV